MAPLPEGVEIATIVSSISFKIKNESPKVAIIAQRENPTATDHLLQYLYIRTLLLAAKRGFNVTEKRTGSEAKQRITEDKL